MKKVLNKSVLVFILFISIYLLFSNGKITTSMDVDVVRYAQNLTETGTYGSEMKLVGGSVYSPKTKMFYPMEGIGIVATISIINYISEFFNIQSTFLIFSTGALFFALTFMFIYKLFLLYLSDKKSLLYSTILAFATPAFVLSKMLFPEPFVMFAISGSLYFYSKHKKYSNNIDLLFMGLFTGLTLLMRPDSPIYYGLITIMVFLQLFITKKDVCKKIGFYLIGLAIFTFVFTMLNYHRFGSITETGYRINKLHKQEIINSLSNDIESLPIRINKALQVAQKSFQKDKNSDETKVLVRKYQILNQSLKDKTTYKKDIESKNNFKVNGIFANKGENGFFNLIKDYFKGIFLIMIYPNRSILFFSPILIFIFFGIKDFFKRFKIESIFLGLTFLLYLSLFALRAPYGYSGTAAWGVRYMLPMYLILGLFFIGFDDFYSKLKTKQKIVRNIFITLFVISIVFQVIGSSINYQHVQMPLEQIITQKYGRENISKSRIELMTKPNCSLLLNNLQIFTGNVPQVLKNHLSENEIKQYQTYYEKQTGPNDWFFYDLFNDGDLIKNIKYKSNYKLLFFILLIGSIGSAYLLFVKKDKDILSTNKNN